MAIYVYLHPESSKIIIQRKKLSRIFSSNYGTIDSSVKNYFFRSVKNLCINLIKHNITKEKYLQNEITEQKSEFDADEAFIEIDLLKKIEESINSLPKKRREIFRLSREEGLKYFEIAQKLNISIKTVETQMSLAIKYLREKLKKYHTFLLLFLCLY